MGEYPTHKLGPLVISYFYLIFFVSNILLVLWQER